MNMRIIEENIEACTNMRQLCTKTGMGGKQLRDEFDKNPMLRRRIENQLNLGKFKSKGVIFPTCPCIVLDCSVVSASNLIEAIDAYVNLGFKFIITSITNKELDRRQEYAKGKNKDVNYRDYSAGCNARRLLRKAVLEEQNFICVEIPEVNLNPDDDIIEAMRGKKNLTLWTGDKSMILSCRMAKIPNMFVEEEIRIPILEKTEEIKLALVDKEEIIEEEIVEEETEYSVFGLKYENGELYVGILNPYTTYIELYDQYGRRKMLDEPLEVGDKIIRIRKKYERKCVYISEEQVLKIASHSNAKLIFNQKYFVPSEVNDIPIEYQEVYKRSEF